MFTLIVKKHDIVYIYQNQVNMIIVKYLYFVRIKMINLPFSNTEINIFTSLYNPNTVHVKNTRAYAFWFRSLYMRLLSPLKINVPWVGDVKDFFNMCLYYNGYVAIFESEEFGFCFQPCTCHRWR